MARKELHLGNLESLSEGRIVKAFNAELRRVLDDCNQRPDDKAERVVNLQLFVSPIKPEFGDPVRGSLRFKIHSKLPPRPSNPFEVVIKEKLTPAGNRIMQMLVNSESEHDAENMTLDEAADDKAEKPKK